MNALARTNELNPKLKVQAAKDGDMNAIRDDNRFAELISRQIHIFLRIDPLPC